MKEIRKVYWGEMRKRIKRRAMKTVTAFGVAAALLAVAELFFSETGKERNKYASTKRPANLRGSSPAKNSCGNDFS